MLNVFVRDGDTIRHFWGSELLSAPTEPGQDTRHVGTLEPMWNLFDFTPAGRGEDFEEQLDYHCHGTGSRSPHDSGGLTADRASLRSPVLGSAH